VTVENGTLPDERVVATELTLLPRAISDMGIHGPAVIFIGLDWESAGLVRPERVEVYEARPGRGEIHSDNDKLVSRHVG
jgi:siroheme synthase